MDWKTKCRLIKSDSPTVVRYFEHRFLQFFNLVVKSPHNPIHQVTDYFMRVEFAGRGTIHIHWFAYLKNAPQYGCENNETVANYYDQIISCTSDVPPEFKQFTDIQRPAELEILIHVGFLFLFHQCERLSYWNQLNMNQNKKRLI